MSVLFVVSPVVFISMISFTQFLSCDGQLIFTLPLFYFLLLSSILDSIISFFVGNFLIFCSSSFYLSIFLLSHIPSFLFLIVFECGSSFNQGLLLAKKQSGQIFGYLCLPWLCYIVPLAYEVAACPEHLN